MTYDYIIAGAGVAGTAPGGAGGGGSVDFAGAAGAAGKIILTYLSTSGAGVVGLRRRGEGPDSRASDFPQPLHSSVTMIKARINGTIQAQLGIRRSVPATSHPEPENERHNHPKPSHPGASAPRGRIRGRRTRRAGADARRRAGWRHDRIPARHHLSFHFDVEEPEHDHRAGRDTHNHRRLIPIEGLHGWAGRRHLRGDRRARRQSCTRASGGRRQRGG